MCHSRLCAGVAPCSQCVMEGCALGHSVLNGHLRIEMEAESIELTEGELYVVPKGVRHNPVAENECLVMLVEQKSTLHTGNEISDRTRSLADQLRPV